MTTVARSLMRNTGADRDLYLFDTFEGMSAPTAEDVAYDGQLAEEAAKTGKLDFVVVSMENVQRAVWSTGYPKEKTHFIKGKVEDTLPGEAPEQIALLRLNTGWYESTRHELAYLFPRLSKGGVLIIDDYGQWQGATKATDEYIKEHNLTLLLQRIDNTARICVKI